MIEVEGPDGVIVEFPDGTPRDIMERAMRERFTPAPPPVTVDNPPAPPLAGAGADGRDIQYFEPGYNEALGRTPPPMPQENTGIGPGLSVSPRALQVGAQGAGRGFADLAGASGDIAVALANAILWGVDKLTGAAPYRFPPSPIGSEAIAEGGSRLAGALGIEPIEQEDMTPSERMAYNINRFGTEAVVAGSGLAAGAGRRAGQLAQNTLPRASDALMRPYLERPGRALVTDLTAGAGSGAALAGAHEYLPEENQGVLTDTAAMLGGGLAGAAVGSLGRAPAHMVQSIRSAAPDPNIPVDPVTMLPVSRRVADRVAQHVQTRTTDDPGNVARSIEDAARDARLHGEPVPSTGVASGDIGFAAGEKAARTRDPVPFQERDQQLRDAAQERVTSLRDRDADPQAPRRMVEDEVADRRRLAADETEAARVDLEAARETGTRRLTAAEQAREDRLTAADQRIAESRTAVAGAREREVELGGDVQGRLGGEGAASERLDRAVVDDTMRPLADEQRRRYRDIDPQGEVRVDASPLVQVAADIRRGVPETVPESEVIPESWLRRIEALGAREVETGLVDDAGRAITRTEGGDISFRDVNEMRPFLSDAIRGAERRGEFGYVRNLRVLKSYIDDEAERLATRGDEAGARAQDAVRFTREEFAPKFSEGEGGRLRRDVQTGDRARTDTPPTATAGRFLKPGAGGKEVAEDLNRILTGSPSEAAGREAARDYVLADMARVVGSDGKINPNRLRVWIANREGMFEAMPGLKDEATATLRDVVNRRQATTDLQTRLERNIDERKAAVTRARREIESIKADTKLTERQKASKLAEATRKQADLEHEIRKSATSLLLDADPAVAVRGVFSSKDPAGAMREIVAKLGTDQEAVRGWKRAVTEHMIDRVTNTNTAISGGPDGPVSIAKMQRFFDDNRNVLAAVYTPAEMNTLQRAHKILEPLGHLQRQATAGSPTAENHEQAWRVLEAGLKATYGVLKGGGVLRTLKIASGTVFKGDTPDIERLVNRMYLDPELSMHILSRQRANVDTPAWNARLNRILAYGEAARGMADDGADDGE